MSAPSDATESAVFPDEGLARGSDLFQDRDLHLSRGRQCAAALSELDAGDSRSSLEQRMMFEIRTNDLERAARFHTRALDREPKRTA